MDSSNNNSKKQKISALMTCFCSQEFDSLGVNIATQNYENSLGDENAVCSEWFFDKGMQRFLDPIISVVTVLINMILVYVVEICILWMKLTTETANANSMLLIMFIVVFLNTAVIGIAQTMNYEGNN
jgi:hypothetical protein